jgi:hypothetical protein
MDDGSILKQEKHGNNLERVKDQFKRWRRSRVRGEHIPAYLWSAAQSLLTEYDAQYVAASLNLDAERLKKRLSPGANTAQASKGMTHFVELTVAPTPLRPPTPNQHECVVELENGRGAKMRVELNGQGMAGLATLCNALWSAP